MRRNRNRREFLKLTALGPIGSVVPSTKDGDLIQSSTSPTASFSYSPSSPVPDEDVNLDGTDSSSSDGEITGYQWSVEDSSGRTESYYSAQPTHSWSSGGTFDVTLEVTDENGGTDTTTNAITVENPTPSADFSYSPSTPVPDEQVTLDGTESTDPDGEITNYTWSLERASGRTESYYSSQPAHSWDSGGSFDVSLEVTDNGGKTDTITKTIDVDNPAPQADFDFHPSSPVPDTEVTLDGTISTDSDGEIENYTWEVEDSTGRTERYYSSKPTHTWGSGGEFSVTLQVTDNGGETNTTTKTVVVDNSAPTSDFSISPSSPTPDEAVELDGTDSHDPDGEVSSYRWEVETASGRTEVYYSAQPTHSWDVGGEFDVTLEVVDNGGTSSTVTKTVDVDNATPDAEFSIDPSQPVADEEVMFDGTDSDDADGEISKYRWEIEDDDGRYESYYSAQPVHTWRTEGSYQVTLEVTDNGGASSTKNKTIRIGNTPPSADFSVSTDNPMPGEAIEFDATESTDEEKNIRSYQWEIDGDTKTGESITHEFSSAGDYVVKLRVEDSRGATDSSRETISIGKEGPKAEFIHSPENVTTNSTTTFIATYSRDPDGKIEEYHWELPNGSSMHGESIEYTFTEGGDQSIILTVTDNDGRTSQAAMTVSVSESSVASSVDSAKSSDPDSPEPSPGGDRDTDQEGNVPFTVGALILGGGAVLYKLGKYFTGNDDQRLDQKIDSARAGFDRGDRQLKQGNYEKAVEAYDSAIASLRAVQSNLDDDVGDELRKEIGALITEIEERRDAIEIASETELEVRKALQNAENSFQTALSEHANHQLTAARRDYRQARDHFDQALTVLNQTQEDILENNVTFPVQAEPFDLPPEISKWPYFDDEAISALHAEGIDSVSDLKEAGESEITEMEESGVISEETAMRLRATIMATPDEQQSYRSIVDIDQRRKQADDFYQSV